MDPHKRIHLIEDGPESDEAVFTIFEAGLTAWKSPSVHPIGVQRRDEAPDTVMAMTKEGGTKNPAALGRVAYRGWALVEQAPL